MACASGTKSGISTGVIPIMANLIMFSNHEKSASIPYVTATVKKNKSVSTAIIAGSSLYGGLELGKKLGVKFSGVVEKQFLEFTKDFCKKPFAALPQKAVAGIKWGVGGLFAYLAGAIVLRDANKDGEADILGSVKKLFKPTPPPPKAEPIIIEG